MPSFWKAVRGALIATLIAVTSFGWIPQAYAYEVTPLRFILDPASGKRSATISVNNIRDEDLFIEVKTLLRVVERDGSQTLEPVEGVFVVFPPQRKIPAKSSQAVRVQFVGANPSDQSESYVIQIVEVPVERPGFSGIRYTYNFGVAAYVDAPNAKPELKLSSGEFSEGSLHFTIRNDGSGYGFTTGYALQFVHDGKRQVLEPGPLSELIEMPIIPPFSERDFAISIPGVSAGPVSEIKLIDRKE